MPSADRFFAFTAWWNERNPMRVTSAELNAAGRSLVSKQTAYKRLSQHHL